jgi:DNA-binding LytR/AlgR family response regulator
MTFAVTKTKTEYPVDLSLEKLMSQLNPVEFFRINRQFLIHIHSIKNIHVFPKSRLKLELNPPYMDEVFVSLDKVTDFKEWLDR